MTAFIDVTDATFDVEVLQSKKPVLVDLWAPWCGPCRSLAPTLDALAAERGDAIKFVKVNVDDCTAVADRFPVRGIPALLLFRDGGIVDMSLGVHPKSKIERWMDEALLANTPVQSEQDFAAQAMAEAKAESEKGKAFLGKLKRRLGQVFAVENGIEIAGGVLLAFNVAAAPVAAVLGAALVAECSQKAFRAFTETEADREKRAEQITEQAEKALHDGTLQKPSAWQIARSFGMGGVLPVAAGAAMLASDTSGLVGVFAGLAGGVTVVRGVLGGLLVGGSALIARKAPRDAGQGPS